MRKTIIIVLLILPVMAGGLYFFGRGGEGIPVKVIPVDRGEITSTLSATGKVMSREDAEISASMASLVKSVYAAEGDSVAQGAVLALLDQQDLKEKTKSAAEAVREAEEKAQQAQREYDALSGVYAAGGASRQSVDDAGSRLRMARASAGKMIAELNSFRITMEKLKVRAPFSGIITHKGINPGEWTSPGTAIFSLSKENSRKIELMVDESDAGLLRTGQQVELSCDAFPGQTWIERIEEVAPAARKEGVTSSIKVRLSYGAKAPGLKLGQQVDARIRTAYRADALRLPFNAVINRGGKSFAAIARDEKVVFVPIATGIEDATRIEIVKGVMPGQKVIVPEGKPLHEGEKVKPVPAETSRP